METAAFAAKCGAELAAADIFDEASLRAGLDGCDVAINLATSLPGPRGTGDFAKNDRLRREGTPNFVNASRAVGVPRILQQSIAMVHAGGGAAWADETTFHAIGEGIAGAAIFLVFAAFAYWLYLTPFYAVEVAGSELRLRKFYPSRAVALGRDEISSITRRNEVTNNAYVVTLVVKTTDGRRYESGQADPRQLNANFARLEAWLGR